MTAVEWLIDQLEQHHVHHNLKDTVVFNQAKEMEKQQIEEAFKHGRLPVLFGELTAEQYYQETFKK